MLTATYGALKGAYRAEACFRAQRGPGEARRDSISLSGRFHRSKCSGTYQARSTSSKMPIRRYYHVRSLFYFACWSYFAYFSIRIFKRSISSF